MFNKESLKVYENTPLGTKGLGSLMGYGMSKWVAEHYIRQARERGIPTSIFRPGFISFHTNTGYSNPTDYLCRLVGGIVHVNSYPSTNSMLDFSPANYVASNIIRISMKKESIGKVFHPVSPYHQVQLHVVVEALSKFLRKPLKQLPTEEWLQLLRSDKTLAYGAILSHLFSGNEVTLSDYLDSSQFKSLAGPAYFDPEAKITNENLFVWFSNLLSKSSSPKKSSL